VRTVLVAVLTVAAGAFRDRDFDRCIGVVFDAGIPFLKLELLHLLLDLDHAGRARFSSSKTAGIGPPGFKQWIKWSSDPSSTFVMPRVLKELAM
jgi:hypothetical protein